MGGVTGCYTALQCAFMRISGTVRYIALYRWITMCDPKILAKLADIQIDIAKIHMDIIWMKRVVLVIVAIVAAVYGVDIAGVCPGL